MLIDDFRFYSIIIFIITSLIFSFLFVSLLTNKSPAIVIMLSVINIFFSSYMSVASYGVVKADTLPDGAIAYNTLNTNAFDPLFYSGLFQIIYWFSIIAFILGVAFSLVVIYDGKTKKKIPKWKQEFNERNNWET